jgi:hypothetical protein
LQRERFNLSLCNRHQISAISKTIKSRALKAVAAGWSVLIADSAVCGGSMNFRKPL